MQPQTFRSPGSTRRSFNRFHERPISELFPGGWIRRYLLHQKSGLTGHLDEIDYPFNKLFWGNSHAENPEHPEAGDETTPGIWWAYEQTGYWIDGLIRCAYLLDDAELTAKAEAIVENVLTQADHDGYLGPVALKNPIPRFTRWPHAVFFRVLMAYHSRHPKSDTVARLRRHYLGKPFAYADMRDINNLEAMLWTYHQSNDDSLKDLAFTSFDAFCQKYEGDIWAFDALFTSGNNYDNKGYHGVTFNELAKHPALLYGASGRPELLQASINAYHNLDTFSMLADGVHSSDEKIKGRKILDAHETCDISDYTWSIGCLLLASGNAEWADKMEKAVFNAAPGAQMNDFKAVQYYSCPNQVVARASSSPAEWPREQFRAVHKVQCCAGNANRAMPNYGARMWLADDQGDPVAALYGPGTLRFEKNGVRIEIEERTQYPFSDTIEFLFHCATKVAMAFHFRIPHWCESPSLSINGRLSSLDLKTGTFATVDREFSDLDCLCLHLPRRLKLCKWPRGGVSIEYGPLVFALPIRSRKVVSDFDKSGHDSFPAWDLYPDSPWNYALDLSRPGVLEKAEVLPNTDGEMYWSEEHPPLKLVLPARRIDGWDLRRVRTCIRRRLTREMTGSQRIHGPFYFTPDLPEAKAVARRAAERPEDICLVPYGCTSLRITIFPVFAGEDPGQH